MLLPFLRKEKVTPMRMLLLTSLCGVLFLTSFLYTSRMANAAMAVTMQQTSILYVIVFNLFKHRKVVAAKLVTVALITVGIVINMQSVWVTASHWAIVTGLMVGLMFVLYSVGMKSFKTGSPLGIMSGLNLIIAACMLVLLPLDFTPYPTNVSHVLVVAVYGIVVSGFSYVLYGASLKRISLETAMLIVLLEPVLNPIWVYLATGEIPPQQGLIGMGFIVAGAAVDVAYHIYIKKRGGNNFEQ